MSHHFYDAETDSLFLPIMAGAYHVSREVAPGVVIDFDTSGQPLAIDIENASKLIHRTGGIAGLAKRFGVKSRRRAHVPQLFAILARRRSKPKH